MRYVFSFDLNAAGDMFAYDWWEIVPHRRSADRCMRSFADHPRSELETMKCSELTQTIDVRLRASYTGTQSISRYVGATPLTHFHAITADLKVTRRRTEGSISGPSGAAAT